MWLSCNLQRSNALRSVDMYVHMSVCGPYNGLVGLCSVLFSYVDLAIGLCFTPLPAAVCHTGADNQRDLGDEGEQTEEHCQLLGQLPGWGHRAMGEWAFVKRGVVKPLHNEPGSQDWCMSSLLFT